MNNVQVNGGDIEKVSRHCPALKVLHLFFVNFQVTQLAAKSAIWHFISIKNVETAHKYFFEGPL